MVLIAFIIDGKRIKSVNRWYNKENARLQSIKDTQKITQLTNRQIRLLQKRSHILRDFLNKTTSYMIQHCLEHGIGKTSEFTLHYREFACFNA